MKWLLGDISLFHLCLRTGSAAGVLLHHPAHKLCLQDKQELRIRRACEFSGDVKQDFKTSDLKERKQSWWLDDWAAPLRM